VQDCDLCCVIVCALQSQLVEYYYLWKKSATASTTRPHRQHRRQSLRRQAQPTPTPPSSESGTYYTVHLCSSLHQPEHTWVSLTFPFFCQRISKQASIMPSVVSIRFYCAMLCIRGTSHGPVSVCLCLSDISRSSTKTAKRRITQTTPHDSPGTLVF